MNKGFFITLEGGEGCGKSTQLKMLGDALRKALPEREILESRSPGGTTVAEKVRTLLKERTPGEDLTPQTELLLFAACHAQMCKCLIRPALERKAILLVDRFCDSTEVYQGCARGVGQEWVRKVDDFACQDVVPDLTLLLDIDPEAGLRRTVSRAGQSENDRFDSESLAFHQAIRKGFLKLAEENPERIAVIDASRSLEEVHKQITEVIHDRLGIL